MTPRPPLPRSAWFLIGAGVEATLLLGLDVWRLLLARRPVRFL